jgi:hypothetical protein
MAVFTSLVVLDRWPHIQKQLESMKAKAFKLCLEPIYFYTAPVNSPIWVYYCDGLYHSSEEPPNDRNRASYTGLKLERIKVTVSGEPPVLNGWKLVCKLVPTPDRTLNVLMTVPGYTNPKLIDYIDKVGICEHCNTTRMRNDTYVVQHTDGTLKAVGKSCMADFLGGTTPSKVLAYGEQFLEIADVIKDFHSDYYNSPSFKPTVDMREFLAASVRYIEEKGWISRQTSSEYTIPSTSDFVWAHFCPRPGDPPRLEIKSEDYEVADKVITWMAKLDGNNEYCINLRTLAGQDVVSPATRGLVCSAAHSFRRNAAEATTKPHKDEFFGSEGSRYTTKVRLLMLRTIPGYYGETCIHKFVSSEGHTIVWFASSGKWMTESYMDRDVEITFRVKKHDMYGGKKQTVVSHVKFTKE